jgi:hypothetical protein
MKQIGKSIKGEAFLSQKSVKHEFIISNDQFSSHNIRRRLRSHLSRNMFLTLLVSLPLVCSVSDRMMSEKCVCRVLVECEFLLHGVHLCVRQVAQLVSRSSDMSLTTTNRLLK